MSEPESIKPPDWKDFIRDQSEPMRACFREHPAYPARVWGQGFPELANGKAILEADLFLGRFYPTGGWPKDTLPESATSLELLDTSPNRNLELRGFWPDSKGRFFHFHYLEIGPDQMRAAVLKITTPVTVSHKRKGFAEFDSEYVGDEIWVILDRGEGQDSPPLRQRVPRASLSTDAPQGIDWGKKLPPILICDMSIEIEPFLKLPPGRRGFALLPD
jgi:hypothetical protein